MEIERCPQKQQEAVVAKKLWNIFRIMFLMLRKGIAKSKVVVDFHSLLKRAKFAAAGKAIANTLTLHHYRSRNDVVYHRDYEFSCSNSPAFFPLHVIKRKHHHRHHHYDDVLKVLEMLNNSNKVEASPLVTLPGFRKSPIGKQIRVTDSPFPLKDEELGDSHQVDVAAEEFIKRFYKELNSQQKFAAIDSPYRYDSWDR